MMGHPPWMISLSSGLPTSCLQRCMQKALHHLLHSSASPHSSKLGSALLPPLQLAQCAIHSIAATHHQCPMQLIYRNMQTEHATRLFSRSCSNRQQVEVCEIHSTVFLLTETMVLQAVLMS